ncbi:atypical/PIKK/TRRAP protein kinase [Sparassis latifolia]
MESTPPLTTAADLDMRAARVADPSIDLKTKLTVACELREMIDTVRDAESSRVLPHMIPVLLQLLKTGEASFQKDALEYQFRRCLLDTLHRIPSTEVIRPQALLIFQGMLYILRHDNEENGITCCKTIMDLVRSFRALNEELLSEFLAIFQEILQNMKGLVDETLSEDSPLMDSNLVLPATRSFKVLAEIAMVIVTFLQVHRPLVLPKLQATLPMCFNFVAIESSAQKRAREDFEAMGNFWTGMAPTIKNSVTYTDYISAEIKVISYSAYVLRALGEQYQSEGEMSEGEILILAALRVLQDCPAMALTARKDLMVVFRHLMLTPSRRALVSQIDKLFDERVLLGTGVGSRETIRSTAFACFADLLHHLRGDLTPAQLTRICTVYIRHLQDPFLTNHLHILSAKMIFNLVEVIVTKDSRQGAGRILTTLLEASVDKIESLADVRVELTDKIEKAKKGESDLVDFTFIEKARPVSAAIYAIEKPEDVIHEYRVVFRTMLHMLRHTFTGLKKCDAPVPDGEIVSRLFVGSIRCLAFYDGEPLRDANEIQEWLGAVLVEANLHVLQEVWTQKIEFFFESVKKRPMLMHLAQVLFTREVLSPTLVAIVLKFLLDRLPLLGEYDAHTAAIAIKMFKMAFGAVTLFPSLNEPILASHLGKLIMDCFPLAAKATNPVNYFHLLRGLFRAIGGGGGRFELLYKEVLPLLPEMLQCLHRQLLASHGASRDLVVELCLTVPLRLTHLLPYLNYLMQPLVLALRGNPELVSQGLRTLELCIDNLTPDFLDPTLNAVLRELMEALHSHLKPVPANHHHAHTTIRILGKLGGRNRRLLDKEPALQWHHFSDPTRARFSFGGMAGSIELGPMSVLAVSALTPGNTLSPYRNHAYGYVEACLTLLLHEGIRGRDKETVFIRCLEGLFDAIHLPELQDKAENNIRELSHFVFNADIRTTTPKERRYPSLLLACYLNALPHGLARENPDEALKAQQLVSTLIHDLVAMANSQGISSQDVIPTLYHIASRFSSLCLEDSWVHRSAGCGGIRIMTHMPDLGMKWIKDRELDLIRTLLHVLKDMPYDLPRDVDEVVDVLIRVLRVGGDDLRVLEGEEGAPGRNKLAALTSLFFGELSTSNAIVRRTAQQCIDLLAELSGRTPAELLLPHRDRMLTAIYTKPLRALPFPIQIGMIEAVRYCISLDPPLPELNDELLRLLHETLALADADDMALLGRGNPRQGSLEIIKLRVACIKLLTASMPLTDFFSKQHQTRQRVTSVYFKSLYSPVPEVKDVAHEGLRMVLTHQSRLPKELLQTGLRPILMNLADPKRLSIPGLEGLARLLELLTNYFKVEIGYKLLDHFRIVADPQMLQASSRQPLLENEGITKLVRLANIFHLLPSAANVFLENLVNAIVQTEAAMHFSGQSPFSEPLAKYLDRYPVEAVDFFMRNLQLPRHVRTLRSILQARLASNLLRELTLRTSTIVASCFESRNPSLILPGLLLCSDLADLVPDWLVTNCHAVDAILALWKVEPTPLDQSTEYLGDVDQRYTLMLSIFQRALRSTARIDLLFDMIAVFSREHALDMIHLSQFFYSHVAFSSSLTFRRNVLWRFFVWFDDQSVPWSHKTHLLQYVVTPTLLVHSVQTPSKSGLLDNDMVQRIHSRIWKPLIDDVTFSGADDTFKIELLHLTTVMVHQYPDFLQEVKKDIIKCAWHYITSEDPLVKQTAYLLAARFFEAFDGPQKFLLRVWTGLLRPPHNEGKTLVRQALDILASVLPRAQTNEVGYPQWAKTTRRLLAEEGSGASQIGLIYQLIVRQASLFYPVRALFIPHIVNYLTKLGLSNTSTLDSRLLSIDILQVIFDWELQATSSKAMEDTAGDGDTTATAWVTPLAFRETMVSYLVRLATGPQDMQARNNVVSRALALLRLVVGPTGWSDVTVKLHYFSRALEQNDLNGEVALNQAIFAAKVLQVVSSEKDNTWYSENAEILTKLVRKGMTSEDHSLQDSLHLVFDHLIRIFPLPKEEDDHQTDVSDFHSFIYTVIGDNLRNAENLRVTPERIEPFSGPLMKLLYKLTKDHVASAPSTNGFDLNVRLLEAILHICRNAVVYLGDQRKHLLNQMVFLVEKSKSGGLCAFMLDIAREWAMNKRDPYPTMKEKASLLQKMAAFEMRGERGEALFNAYLELIYDIYTDSGLRRSDLTTRLEQPFLLGCRAPDVNIRERFIDLLDMSVPRSLFNRLTYVIGVQSWEALADHNWIFLALHLILGTVDTDISIILDRKGSLDAATLTPPFTLGRASSLIRPMQRLAFLDPQAAHETWVSVFPAAWACLSRREQVDLTHHMITLLSKEYHVKQSELRPNVIQTLLTGIHACSPPMTLPPHLVKYLAKTFGAWHVAAEFLEASLTRVREDESVVRDTVYDSLAEIYAELAEDDIFYGLWRRHALFKETEVAITFEQCGMWEQAASMYEIAQNKTRTGNLPYSEIEFCLWEDHWMLAAEKLQQWDTLYEVARGENNHELMLESAWRIKDWAENRDTLEGQISMLPDVATPRRRVFEAFVSLLKSPGALDRNQDFTKLLEDAMQLSLRKWISLPPQLSAAHIPLLQHFQQFVELQEAVQIFGSLSTTNAQNLEKKSSDLKMVLQAWRERLPNICDDISIWSDLVAWRQNVFNAINKAYIPLITSSNQTGGTAAGSTNTFGYRGYHETAWIINRFAHVARKHELLDVCFNSLNRIYTLPNIEISEAFLKLREQARCHYQKPGDLQAGLEVINNTNLMYFSTTQKAEFYTLKGMFHAKFGRNEEANQAFGQAVQLDMLQAKAWAAWGKFNDRMFKDLPSDMSYAANAVSCYLQAAGQYKSRKSRPLLARVLWLLSVDDGTLTISRAFDTYKGDAAFWYWITLIPQLCLSISHREIKQARYILLNLAKLYPQALFFHLRTTREDMAFVKRQAAAAAQRSANVDHSQVPTATSVSLDSHKRAQSDQAMQDSAMDGGSDVVKPFMAGDDASQLHASPGTLRNPSETSQNVARPIDSRRVVSSEARSTADPTFPHPGRASWECVEEVVQILKTAFPLLILSLETLVEHIIMRFKGTQEEEIYRLVSMLLQDALQQYMFRASREDDNGQLPEQIIKYLPRYAGSLSGSPRRDYEEDFLKNKMSLYDYIRKLQQWRDRYERYLNSRPREQSLDLLSHYLTEFQYSKFDEIEVPGQYTEDKDNNQNFVRIQKFGPKFENCHTHGYYWRRITIHGNDHSKTSFAIQLPSGRHCRREERVMQLFRTFNAVLYRKKEGRKRNLQFHLPAAVSCGPNVRLMQNDASYITLADIYDQHCEDSGIAPEDPSLVVGERMKVTLREYKQRHGKLPSQSEYHTLKMSLLDEVTKKVAPEDILTRYMIRTMDGPGELWRMRKQFTLQLCATSFMTYVLCLTSRTPTRFHLSRTTGQMAMSELLPGITSHGPFFASGETVPFRYTPNMQHFIKPILGDGVLASGIMAIGRCLTEPEYDLEQQLYLFTRDEVMTWMHSHGKPWTTDLSFRDNVTSNIGVVVKRAEAMACRAERDEGVPTGPSASMHTVLQTVMKMIADATNPAKLAVMQDNYVPWF